MASDNRPDPSMPTPMMPKRTRSLAGTAGTVSDLAASEAPAIPALSSRNSRRDQSSGVMVSPRADGAVVLCCSECQADISLPRRSDHAHRPHPRPLHPRPVDARRQLEELGGPVPFRRLRTHRAVLARRWDHGGGDPRPPRDNGGGGPHPEPGLLRADHPDPPRQTPPPPPPFPRAARA